jgi:hypothetical protein
MRASADFTLGMVDVGNASYCLRASIRAAVCT